MEARLPGRSAGTRYLGRGGGRGPPQGRGPGAQPGPPQPVEERRQRLRHDQERHGRLPVLGPRRDREEAAPLALPRTRGSRTGLTCSLLPARPFLTRRRARRWPSRRALRAEGGRLAHRPPRTHHCQHCRRRVPPLHSSSLRRTPSPGSLRPAPRHVTSSRPAHVTTPFLYSPPPAPAPLPASLRPAGRPGPPGEAV